MKTAEQIVDKFKRMSWDHEYAENGILSVTDAIKAMQSFAAQSVTEYKEKLVDELLKEHGHRNNSVLFIDTVEKFQLPSPPTNKG